VLAPKRAAVINFSAPGFGKSPPRGLLDKCSAINHDSALNIVVESRVSGDTLAVSLTSDTVPVPIVIIYGSGTGAGTLSRAPGRHRWVAQLATRVGDKFRPRRLNRR